MKFYIKLEKEVMLLSSRSKKNQLEMCMQLKYLKQVNLINYFSKIYIRHLYQYNNININQNRN